MEVLDRLREMVKRAEELKASFASILDEVPQELAVVKEGGE